jgi:hypothetical protein
MDTETKDALAFMHAEPETTGGTAFRIELSDESDLLITSRSELPTSLTEPVSIRHYRLVGDGIRECSEERQYDTLAAALLELYGPIEGEPLPEPLAACRAAAS